MSDTLTGPPFEFIVSEHLTWEVSLPDYLSTDGWQLRYAFVSDEVQIKVPGGVGDVTDAGAGVWTALLTGPQTSANFTDFGSDGLLGEYRWQEYVEKAAAAERKFLRWGMLFAKIPLDAAAAASGLDIRSRVKRILDAIDALIEGKASKDQASYSIAGRALSRYTWDELVVMREHYASQWEREVAFDRMRHGKESPMLVRGRFPAAGTI